MRRNILLGAVVVVIFFVVLEGGLRLTGLVGTDALRSPGIETLDRIPGLFEPGQDLVDRIKPSVPYHIHINSLGLRGHDFPRANRPGVARILCLGDSYTFGAHVDDEQTFPAQLERILAAEEGAKVEVINAGASGFTITDELVYLREKGLDLHPDLIVLAFSQNDIRDMSRDRPMIDTMKEHAGLKSSFLIGPMLRFLQHTAIFNGMQRTAALINVGIRKANEPEIFANSPELWRQYLSSFKELVTLARQHGVKVLLVIWPSADQMAGVEPTDPQERLTGAARELLIDSLDLLPALKAVPPDGGGAFLLPLDGHPSPRGQEAAAHAIAGSVVPLLPTPEK